MTTFLTFAAGDTSVNSGYLESSIRSLLGLAPKHEK